MRKAVLVAALVVSAMGMLAPTPATAQSSRPTVAVLDLDYGTVEK